jgi:uncharacterized membrane protein YhaH (DUF805 family)
MMDWLFSFDGRINRRGYIARLVVSWLLSWVIIGIVVSISAHARRFHDIGKSGWWILIFIVPLLGFIIFISLLIQRGDFGPNEFGEEPS